MVTILRHDIAHAFAQFDPEKGSVIVTPEAPGQGYWAGAPSVFYDTQRESFLLTYRRRRPRGTASDRGYQCFVAESKDGITFHDIWTITKEQLGTTSMERFHLQKSPDGQYVLYLSYVDPADNRWRIDVIKSEQPDTFNLAQAKKVLTADDTGTEGVKDPFIWKVGPAYYMFVSFAKASSWTKEEQTHAHATADVYTTGLTIAPSGLAVSMDGVRYQWAGEIFPVGEGWDRYQSRLTSIIRVDDVFVGFYDGSADATENYEERCGLATSFDLKHWDRLTVEQPWVVGPYGTGSVRYIQALTIGEELWLYYEYNRSDAAHELRLARLSL